MSFRFRFDFLFSLLVFFRFCSFSLSYFFPVSFSSDLSPIFRFIDTQGDIVGEIPL